MKEMSRILTSALLEESVYHSPSTPTPLVFEGPANRAILKALLNAAKESNVYVESFEIDPNTGNVEGVTYEGEVGYTTLEVYSKLQRVLYSLK